MFTVGRGADEVGREREAPTTYGSTAMAAEPDGMPLFFLARLWQS